MSAPKENGAELISAYLDAELDDAESEAVESMLSQSAEARAELEELRKVVALVSALPDVEAPEDFIEKLNRRMRRKQMLQGEAGSKFAAIAMPFQVLSIIVILVVAALYMMTELDRKPVTLERDPKVNAEPESLDDAEPREPIH
jgi:anti-sigma factor RsiW